VGEIARFFGIVIAMYDDEHNPPHFHVRYAEQRAAITIRTLGDWPRPAFAEGVGAGVRMVVSTSR
jgi:hypothetical protein